MRELAPPLDFDFSPNLFEPLSDSVLLLDQSLAIHYFNPACTNMFSMSARKLGAVRNIDEIFEPGTAAILAKWIVTVDEDPQTQELDVQVKPGLSVRNQISVQKISSVSGRPCWLVLFRDMSLEVRLHEKYRKAMALKEEAIGELQVAQSTLTAQTNSLELFAFVLVCSIMGFSYLAIRYTAESIPPLLAAGTRCFIPGLIVMIFHARKHRLPNTVEWKEAVWISFLRRAVPQGAMTWALLRIPSGLVALMMSTIPLWLAIIELSVGSKQLSRISWAGIALGIFGLFAVGIDSINAQIPLLELGILVAATFLNGVGVYRASTLSNPVQFAAFEMGVGGVLLLLAAFFHGEFQTFNFSMVTERSTLAMLYLMVFGTLAQTALIWIITVRNPVHGMSFLFMVPAISLILGWTIGHEVFHWLSAFACVFLVSSVFLVRRRPSRPDKPPKPSAVPQLPR